MPQTRKRSNPTNNAPTRRSKRVSTESSKLATNQNQDQNEKNVALPEAVTPEQDKEVRVPADVGEDKSAPKSKRSTAKKAADGGTADPLDSLEYIYLCRPYWDIESERWEDDDYDPEEDQEEGAGCPANPCVCKDKSLEDARTWPWSVTKAGFAVLEHSLEEAMNRDQDEHSMYIYNDFTGYGVLEVVQNWVLGFNKEIKKKSPSAPVLLSHLEGLALFLRTQYTDMWFGSDDSQGNAEAIDLIGTAVVSSLHLFVTQGLIGKIPNLPTIMALYINFAQRWNYIVSEITEETLWVKEMITIGRKHNLQIRGPYKIEEDIEEFDDEELPDKEDAEFALGKLPWKGHFKLYEGDQRVGSPIGGTRYDISKMSKAEKKRHGF